MFLVLSSYGGTYIYFPSSVIIILELGDITSDTEELLYLSKFVRAGGKY